MVHTGEIEKKIRSGMKLRKMVLGLITMVVTAL